MLIFQIWCNPSTCLYNYTGGCGYTAHNESRCFFKKLNGKLYSLLSVVCACVCFAPQGKREIAQCDHETRLLYITKELIEPRDAAVSVCTQLMNLPRLFQLSGNPLKVY